MTLNFFDDVSNAPHAATFMLMMTAYAVVRYLYTAFFGQAILGRFFSAVAVAVFLEEFLQWYNVSIRQFTPCLVVSILMLGTYKAQRCDNNAAVCKLLLLLAWVTAWLNHINFVALLKFGRQLDCLVFVLTYVYMGHILKTN